MQSYIGTFLELHCSIKLCVSLKPQFHFLQFRFIAVLVDRCSCIAQRSDALLQSGDIGLNAYKHCLDGSMLGLLLTIGQD